MAERQLALGLVQVAARGLRPLITEKNVADREKGAERY